MPLTSAIFSFSGRPRSYSGSGSTGMPLRFDHLALADADHRLDQLLARARLAAEQLLGQR